MEKDKHVLIAGAGLVGSLLSIYLSRRGYRVTLYERRGDMRREEVQAGRSINLALSDRGIRALQEVGIAEAVQTIAIPMHGRDIHTADGKRAFQPYGREGQYINSVSRGELNKKLMDLAEAEGVELYFNHRCHEVDWENKLVQFEREDAAIEIASFDIFLGADGAYSAARMQHMTQHHLFDYQQFYIDCGYKEIAIPAGTGGTFLLEKNALHIWPRKDYMLIALPNLDGSFTGTLFFPFAGDTSFEQLTTPEAVAQFFGEKFPEVVQLVPDLTEQFFHNPTSSLVTVKCFPWIREDYFSLIGDAAHAIVPFFGQGMNCGFEDCVVLNQLLDQYDDNWEEVLPAFQLSRKIDADAIAELALNNFIEMRERTADPKFLLQKKIEARLHEKYPDKWVPAYTQVTFSPDIRYSDALRNAQRQEAIMQEVMSMPGIEISWQSEEVEHKILSLIG
ncbi:MAG: kynurenine 3-monooxygenase [Sphingobacteriales bacterium SCN 48-20]|uniref:FAD-dependent oxidoreductase n=1 Tax=Terrimonas ferruginea TaxID=249 RepID=UPI00086D0231|nr:NAD(P)/FAD-dependent oxidoreductase [Terrimonas ferruginea]MBN8784815.1 FAD-dependent monooxygenase [Terrimonas ferruginea]ODT94955.1 MAG: kynurenine 3-monooxygenase [Sphingobacteriales bacterium SCN 48-20]OJW45351.1 MAG: kynurenine 3-monooxygenase [Sphingobacteriales bacterium 48-107]